MAKAMSSGQDGMNDNMMQEIWRRMDADNDGTVTQAEAKAEIRRNFDMNPSNFNEAQGQSNGEHGPPGGEYGQYDL